MCKSGRHAVVLEAAGRVHSFVLQEQAARLDPHVRRDGVGFLEQRLPFADRDDFLDWREWQQFVKPPDPAEAARFVTSAPHFFKCGQALRRIGAIPVVLHVEQVSALVARDTDFFDSVLGPTSRGDALLVGDVGK
jgi:hypothetical protein